MAKIKFSPISIFSIFSIIALIFIFSFKADGKLQYDFCLQKSYEFYKQNFMSSDGRILDPDRNNITTSEGQSYMLLRTLVTNDRATFDLVYKWTKDNLQRSDKLFAWIWGENKEKKGVYEILDNNSASDADIDIAFALLLAYERWNDPKYLDEATPIIQSIWNNETRKVGDYLVLMPGVAQAYSNKIEVNPSYFSPYAFRYFQKYDELHDWNCLIDSSYYYLNASMAKTKTGLPPNWFLIENIPEIKQGEIQDFSPLGGGDIVLVDSERSDFSYDAIRVFTRIYLDYIRSGEQRALPILEKSKFFIEQWKKDKTFYVNYQANGELRNKDKFIGSIGVLIPIISMYDRKVAAEMYNDEAKAYSESKKYWESKHDYYGKNLLWFGCYLYNNESNKFKNNYNKRQTTDY